MSNEIEDFVPVCCGSVTRKSPRTCEELSLALPTTRSRHLVNRFEELEPVYPGNGDGERYGGNDDDRESDATKQPHLISMQHGVKDKGRRIEMSIEYQSKLSHTAARVAKRALKVVASRCPSAPYPCSNWSGEPVRSRYRFLEMSTSTAMHIGLEQKSLNVIPLG